MWTDYSLGLWQHCHTKYPVMIKAPMSWILCLPSQRLTPSFCWSISSCNFLGKGMRDGDISRSKSQFLALCAPVLGVSSGRRNRVFKAAEAARGILLLNMWGVSRRAVMVLGPVVRTNPEEMDRIQKVWNWYPRKVGCGWNGTLRVASRAYLRHYPFIRFVSEPWWNSVFPLPFLCSASLVPLERKAGADPSALLTCIYQISVLLRIIFWSTSTSDCLPWMW